MLRYPQQKLIRNYSRKLHSRKLEVKVEILEVRLENP